MEDAAREEYMMNRLREELANRERCIKQIRVRGRRSFCLWAADAIHKIGKVFALNLHINPNKFKPLWYFLFD
jgi:hypothetical protein